MPLGCACIKAHMPLNGTFSPITQRFPPAMCPMAFYVLHPSLRSEAGKTFRQITTLAAQLFRYGFIPRSDESTVFIPAFFIFV